MCAEKQRGKLLLVARDWGIIPPLGIGYIASYLEKHLPELEVDISIVRPGPSAVEDILKKRPDVVGFSSMIRDYKFLRSLAERLKSEKGVSTVIGGPFITPVADTLEPMFDVAVLREGEETTVELMRKHVENGGFHKDFLKDVKGIAYHDNGKVVINADRELINPLDSLPPPARHLMDMEKYTAATYDFNVNVFRGPMSIMTILTSRGCPFDCIFCQSTTFWKKYRMFSAEYITEEMEALLKKYAFNTVHVADDLFVMSKNRLRKIVEYIEENGWNKKLKFWILARVDSFTEEICDLLKRMNVFHVAFGFESNSPEILKKLKKDTSTVEQNEQAVRLAKKYGFEVQGFFLIGNPDETLEDMQKTYEFAMRNPIDKIGVEILTPLPGTELWDYAVEKGKVDKDTDMAELFPYSSDEYMMGLRKYGERAFLTDRVSEKEFVKMFKKFARLWTRKGSCGRVHLSDFFKPSNWRFIVSNPGTIAYLTVRQLYRDITRNHVTLGAVLRWLKSKATEKSSMPSTP